MAYIFFDLEELGLFGSMGYFCRHNEAMKQKLLLNFDCVSDGDTFLFAIQKKAKTYLPILQAVFTDTETKAVDLAHRNVLYPSDQVNFPCGVGVAALKKTKHGILYMDRIHTKKDIIYKDDNIAYLVTRMTELVERL